MNKLGRYWFAFDDSGSGGNSTINLKPFVMTTGGANNSNYCAKMTWSLGSGIQYPYVGMGTNLASSGTMDISSFTGISFYFKGNRDYQLQLHIPTDGTINGWASYQVMFGPSSDWVKKTYVWSDFTLPGWSPNPPTQYPLDLTKIENITFQPVDGTTAGTSGEIYVDDLYFTVTSAQLPNNPPATPSQPSGPTSGNTGTSYTYSTSATDPDGNQIYYTFDWGDGTTTTTFVNSGSTASASHAWSTAGTYKVKATDTNGASSDWSIALTVIITVSTSTGSSRKGKNYILTLNNDGINETITFDEASTIKIYTAKGDLIKILDTNQWDGQDKSGKKVKSGIYIYQIIAESIISGIITVVK